MRIGIIVGDPEVTDGFLKSSRPWLRNVPTADTKGPKGPYAILKNDGDLKNRVYNRAGTYVYIYLSVYYYLVHRYGELHHFDLIYPKDVTYERLMKNDINFYNFFDPVAQATIDVKKAIEYESLLRSLPPDKVYPPISFIDVQHDKCKYYAYLEKKKVPIVPTFCVTLKQWKESASKRSVVDRVFDDARRRAFGKTFVKPVMGTSGSFTTMFPMEGETESAAKRRLLQHLASVFAKDYPKVVFQKFIPQFATDTLEVRMMFVGDTYQYSIVSESRGDGDGEAYGMAALKNEGGTYTYDPKLRNRLKKMGEGVMRKIQPLFGKLPKLVTRVDVGCCLDGSNYFVNEIEYAPAFLTSWFKRRDRVMIDVEIAEQMMRIIKKSGDLKKSMYPMKIRLTNKKPTIKRFTTLKRYKQPTKQSMVLDPGHLEDCKFYILACYRDLCKRNPQMGNRLKWMNKYMIDAGIDMKNTRLMNIYWKEDFDRATLTSEGLLKNARYFRLRDGEIGNLMSNMNALIEFMRSDDPYCIVIEDDIQLKPDFMARLKRLLNEMRAKRIPCDLLWLHNNGYAQYKDWETFVRSTSRTPPLMFTSPVGTTTTKLYRMRKNFVGSTALYLISRRAAATILNRALPFGEKPTDVLMQSDIPPDEVHLSVPRATRLMDDTLEGVFCYSDTDESLIQLDAS